MSVTRIERKMKDTIVSTLGKQSKVSFSSSELDSHADTCVAGANTVLLEDTGQRVKVSPFSEEYKPICNVPIGSCGTAYDLPTGETLLLVIHEAIYFGDQMSHSLLCPN